MTTHGDSVGGPPAEDEVAQLRRAIERRTTIGIALGIVMSRLEVDADTAFDFLRTRSQNENRKLYDLAAEIRESRQIDDADHA